MKLKCDVGEIYGDETYKKKSLNDYFSFWVAIFLQNTPQYLK